MLNDSTFSAVTLTKSLALILATLATLHTQPALAEAGKANMVIGKVTIINAAGEEEPLRRGTEINSGDTIFTDEKGTVQIKMSDGGVVNIKPNSQFEVQTYKHTNNAGTDKVAYSLIKGGLRTVTGSIGKTNKAAFQTITPVATMGIRGTDFDIGFCNPICIAKGGDEGLYLGVISGGVSMTNKSGTVNVNAGKFAHSKSKDIKPTAVENVPDAAGLVKSKGKDAAGNPIYPSISEDYVGAAILLHPESAAEILKQGVEAGVSEDEMINGAKTGGMEAADIAYTLIELGANPNKVLDVLLKTDPQHIAQILSAAMSSSNSDADAIAQYALRKGMTPDQVNSAQAVSNLITLPEELKQAEAKNNPSKTSDQTNESGESGGGSAQPRGLTPPGVDQNLLPQNGTGDGLPVSGS